MPHSGGLESIMKPKIGIRPVIDGRWGGVRESLENQTMNMAKSAAKLISDTLRYQDGTPVECVIGCTTIGGGAEAAKVAEQFQRKTLLQLCRLLRAGATAPRPWTLTR